METEERTEERYSAENLMNYRIAIALVDNMDKRGSLTAEDKKILYTKLGEKYGINSDSIYSA